MSSSGGGKRERPEEGGGRKGIRWDEQNLEENERIKKELNPRKIDEPKTPYLSPMETDEEGDAGHRMRPLALDNPATAAAAAAAVAAAAEAGPAMGNGTSDEAGTSGASGSRGRGRHVRIGGRAWSDSDRTVSPSPRHPEGGSGSGRSPRFGDQYYSEHEGDEDEDEDCNADPQRQEKRRRFKEARKQHYNMREQLARARELMQAAESEESEDLTAAEREQQVGEPQLEQRRSAEDGTFSEGHLDADVESEQEGAAGGGAAVRQRSMPGGAAAAAAAAAAASGGLTGHPLRSPDGHPLPSVSGHPLPAVFGHPLASPPALEGHPLASPSAHPLGTSPAAHPLASPTGHPLMGDTMSD